MNLATFYCERCHKEVKTLGRPLDWIVAVCSNGPTPSDMFCSWTCLAQYSTMLSGLARIVAHEKAQNSTEGDASTPEEYQGPDASPDASAAPQSARKELPRPDAISLSQIHLSHAAGHTDVAIHDLIDVCENLEARIKNLESNLTQ